MPFIYIVLDKVKIANQRFPLYLFNTDLVKYSVVLCSKKIAVQSSRESWIDLLQFREGKCHSG